MGTGESGMSEKERKRGISVIGSQEKREERVIERIRLGSIDYFERKEIRKGEGGDTDLFEAILMPGSQRKMKVVLNLI
jgi:hypothetical protein